MIKVILFMHLVLAKKIMFTPSLGLAKHEMPVKKLVLQEMVISKQFLIQFQSPKITFSNEHFGNCPLRPGNNSEIGKWVDRILLTTFQKYVVPFSDLTKRLVQYLSDNDITYDKSSLNKNLNCSITYFHMNGFHENIILNKSDVSMFVDIEQKYSLKCSKTVHSVNFDFSFAKSFEEVYLIFSDPYFLMDKEFVDKYYLLQDCNMRKIVNLDILVLLSFGCSAGTLLSIKIDLNLFEVCKNVKKLV